MTDTQPPNNANAVLDAMTQYPVHARCGLSHAPNMCLLPYGADIGFPFKAGFAGTCSLCEEEFICLGDSAGRTTILMFADMGYNCRSCVLELLEPYVGPDAYVPMEQRLEALIELAGPPTCIATALTTWTLDPAYTNALLHIVQSGPGTCKTTSIALNSRLHGPRLILNLGYNTTATMAGRAMGAPNWHTFHSHGMRKASRGILRGICEDAKMGLYTSAEAPKNLQLTLVPGEKTAIILSYLHPHTDADGPNSRTSLVVRVFSGFVTDLYSAATNRGFNMPGCPLLSDIPKLMELSRQLTLDINILETSFGALRSAGDIARMVDMCSTPEVCHIAQDTNSAIPPCMHTPMPPDDIRCLLSIFHPSKNPQPCWLQARLMFGCALLSDLHEATLLTATRAAWTTPSNGRVIYITSPVSMHKYRLPCIDFDQQVTIITYKRELISAVNCKYAWINCDEFQDASMSKIQFVLRCIESSNQNGGPGWTTRLRVVGDDDQSINGWNGALPNAFEVIANMITSSTPNFEPHMIVKSVLEESQRLPTLHVQYLTEAYANAWTGYAANADYVRSADAPLLRSAPGAIAGDIQFDVTLKSHPLSEALEWSDTSTNGIIFRRAVDAMHLSPLLIIRGIAHQLSTQSMLFTPRATLLAKLRAIQNTILAGQPEATVTDLLEAVPAEGIVMIELDATYAGCIRVLARELASTAATMLELTRHTETRFSTAACARTWLLTAHASKGQTFARTYIGQPQHFPLERAINAGGISLSQEPRVEYVALSRATRSLCFLRIVEAGDENGMQVLLYWLYHEQ